MAYEKSIEFFKGLLFSLLTNLLVSGTDEYTYGNVSKGNAVSALCKNDWCPPWCAVLCEY